MKPTGKIVPYWNEDRTKYAVLYTKGMYGGWSVMNIPQIAYDKRVVEYVIEHLKIPNWQESFEYKHGRFCESNQNFKEFDEFLCSIGYADAYIPPIAHITVVWIDAGRKWRICDGGECQDHLEFQDEIEWNSFEPCEE